MTWFYLARPRSPSLAVISSPVRKTFWVFISLCKTCLPWRYCKTRQKYRFTNSNENRLILNLYLHLYRVRNHLGLCLDLYFHTLYEYTQNVTELLKQLDVSKTIIRALLFRIISHLSNVDQVNIQQYFFLVQ